MYYPCFNEEHNNFDYNEMAHSRPMTPYELKWHKAHSIFWGVGIIILVASFITTAVCLDGDKTSLIGWISLGTMFGSFLIMVIVGRIITDKYESIMDNAQDIGFDDEILRWEQITQEQNDIAQQWRAEHPLEEAIRKAQLSKNSVDIATAMREYAELIKGE
jgi:hypothetical protein